jgi:hypothetical protein
MPIRDLFPQILQPMQSPVCYYIIDSYVSPYCQYGVGVLPVSDMLIVMLRIQPTDVRITIDSLKTR